MPTARKGRPTPALPDSLPRALRSLWPLLAGLALGASAATPGESPYIEELPVVLTASRLPQPLHEAPGAATVIDRETIAATGYRDLARVLRLVAGMQVGQERGHAQWVTYHGLSNDFPSEMQVLVDGRSVISPSAFGGVDWSALPLAMDEIDRVEVVRGTNASGFGANAFLGVVNIITRHSADLPGASGTLRAGDAAVRDLEAGWSGATGPHSLRVNAATKRDDGFDGLNDASRMDVLTLRADWQPSARDALMLRLGGSAGRRGEGYADSVFGNDGPRNVRNHNHTVHLQWRHNPAPDEEWVLSWYRNVERIREAWTASAPGFPAVPLDRHRDSTRDDLELQHRSAPARDVQLVWGVEARRDRVDSPFLFAAGNPPAQTLVRLFGNAEWRPLAPLTINLGAAQERYSGEPARFSPRLFANWQATTRETLRAGYSRAWRQRIPFELYGDVRAVDPASGAVLVRPFLPNRDLRQTRIDALELGYLGRFTTWSTTLDVRLFNERIHDFILRAPQPDPQPRPLLAGFLGSTRYENLDRPITLRGVEYQLATRPLPGTELRLAHSLIDRRFGPREIDDRTAPYTASLSWLQDWGRGWRSMISVLRMGPLAGGDGFVPSFHYVARPYTTWDANLSWHTRVGTTPVQFGLTAQNLGPRHQEIADRTEQVLHGTHAANPVSRSVWLSVSLPL